MGDLIVQALLSMLCAALGYMLFLKTFIIPANKTVFDIYDNVGYDVYLNEKEITPP